MKDRCDGATKNGNGNVGTSNNSSLVKQIGCSTKRSDLFDANNNGQCEKLAMRGQTSQLRSTVEGSSLGESEDWQLLEADEQQIVSENSNNNHESVQNHNLLNQKEYSEQKTKTHKKFIEVDPPGQKNLSPLLVYTCTAIYSLLPLASILATFTLLALVLTRYYPITLIYLAHTLWKRKTFNRGGQRIDFIYRAKFWSYLAAYFPIKLRYSANFKLDPSDNYILNYSPHGISAFGAVTAFATNGLHFSQLFPGITARFMVHETSFITPAMKETFAFRGDCSVNSASIDYMLSKKSKGNLLTIVVGGLAEADLSDMEVLKIVVANRKGFIKKALVHGANIIPCIAFGENSVFTKVNLTPSSILCRLETFWYNSFKFKHPIYYGRSILSNKLYGVMPYKRPITVVMGDPLIVNKLENPSQHDIDKLHNRYLKQLMSVYEDNSDLCENYDKKIELL